MKNFTVFIIIIIIIIIRIFGSVCLFVCLDNSKLFKLGIGNDLGIS